MGLKGALLSTLVITLLILSVNHVACAQEDESWTGTIEAPAEWDLIEEPLFSVSPGDFTEEDVPIGELYHLERKLVIRNGDSISRFFALSVLAPPPENLEPGYEPIPNKNWMILTPTLIEIEENSSDTVEMSLNIPGWENLTGRRWEAWISVTRMAEPGEVIEIELICKAKIITTEELPSPPSPLLTSLKISEENFTLQAGKSKYLTATLTYDNNVIKGETITWSATAGTIAPSSGKTNTAGQVSVVYTAPSYETYVVVSASYAGSEQYESSSGTSFGTITAPPTGVSMELVIAIAIVIGCAIIGAAILLAKRR